MQGLFEDPKLKTADMKQTGTAPLADKMRPRNLSEFVGQEHLVGEGKILRKLIEADRLPSLIFWGPPGAGKTTLAHIIANTTNSYFVKFSAVTAGIADVKKVVAQAKERLKGYSQRTILFIDELHRFDKRQQDAFLPHVEDGTIILIGATTENPSFEVISPLLSRSRVLVLQGLTSEQIKVLVKRTLNDSVRGLGRYGVRLDNEAMELLSQAANGDARVALNALETAVSLVAQLPSVEPKPTLKVGNADVRRETSLRIENDIRDTDIKRKPTFKVDGKVKGIILTLEIIQEALQKSALRYDRAGEEHYNTISAFIKSLRGSDPDAALYYLARMLEAGEDPLFIARRMVILASEDIGNADPHALPLSVATFQACERIGLPECQINLAQCVTYLASSPKSNASYAALLRAQKDVQETLNEPIPLHIRNAPTFLMKNLGYGKNYKYAHNYEEGYTPQQYLPDKLKNHHYYHPTTYGEEGKIKQRLENLRKLTQSQKNSNSRCPKGLG